MSEMTRIVTEEEHLQNGLGKLRWAAGGEFSATVKPEEALALLRLLEPLEKPKGTVDHRPPFYQEEDDAQL